IEYVPGTDRKYGALRFCLFIAEDTDHFPVFVEYRAAAVSGICSHRNLAGKGVSAKACFGTQVAFAINNFIPGITEGEYGFSQINIAPADAIGYGGGGFIIAVNDFQNRQIRSLVEINNHGFEFLPFNILNTRHGSIAYHMRVRQQITFRINEESGAAKFKGGFCMIFWRSLIDLIIERICSSFQNRDLPP